MKSRSSDPAALVRREIWRALLAFAISPLRMGAYLLRRKRLRRELLGDLAQAAEVETVASLSLPARPLHLFLSCAEASGESHALELVLALRELTAEAGAPPPRVSALGGELLAAAGVEIIGDPVRKAAMGLDAFKSIGFYSELLRKAARHLIEERPDLVIAVDSPALHVPLGHIAKGCSLGVLHYITPQYWAWAPWRVGGYRKAIDHGLTILPFEPAWFRRHGVSSSHVGHPQLDLLANTPAPPAEDPGRRTLVLLPGSRRSVVAANLPWMLGVAAAVRLVLPELEVVIPHDREAMRKHVQGHIDAAQAGSWVRMAFGDLHQELGRARVALSVSGTVLLDLLHHRLPCAVIYRTESRLLACMGQGILSVPWFSSVNLLAGCEVLPEHSFRGRGPLEEVANYLTDCLSDAERRSEVVVALEAAAARLGPPGAARRAAGHILERASRSNPTNPAAGGESSDE